MGRMNLNQIGFAARTGLGQSTVAKILSNDGKITMNVLERISVAVDIPVTYFTDPKTQLVETRDGLSAVVKLPENNNWGKSEEQKELPLSSDYTKLRKWLEIAFKASGYAVENELSPNELAGITIELLNDLI